MCDLPYKLLNKTTIMKKRTLGSVKYILLTCSLMVCFLASQVRAAVTYWDPEGNLGSYATYTGQATSVTPPVPGTLTGTWENTMWSTNTSGATGAPADKGQAAPVHFVEGYAAVFAVGAGATNSGVSSSTTAFTITMNANHTVAGFFDGVLNPNSCIVTINGAGTMTMAANNLNGFGFYDSSDASLGKLIVDVPIAGTTTAGVCPEYNGEVFLNAVNTYSGGTYLGYNSLSFGAAVWHFNNNAAFGTGPLIILNTTGGALVTETSGLTITNAVTMYQKYSANVNTIGSLPQPATLNVDSFGTPQNATFSGPWQLSNGSGWTGANIYANTSPWGNYTVLQLNVGHGVNDSADLLNISGPLSGSCALTKGGSGILQLSGDNSAFSGPLMITNGTLRVGYPTGLGCSGAVSTNGTVTVLSGSAAAATSGTLDLNGYAVNAALVLNGSGTNNCGALVNSNLDETAVLNAPSSVLAALITSPFTSTTIAAPVTVSVTGGGGSGATAVASLGVTSNSFTVTPNTQKYTVMPTISVTGGGGSNAIVPIPLSGAAGTVVGSSAFITAPGFGYSSAPTVALSGGTTSGAGTKPTVTANNSFQLMGIQITSPGSGYTSQPTISLSGTGVDPTGTAVGLISSVTLASPTSIGGPGNMVINSAIGDYGLGVGLTKVGAGTVTLGGVNTYSGATTVTGGKLVGVVGGSCASSAVEVQTGGNTLGVSIPDNTKQWTCAGLTFDDSTTTSEFNFGSVTPSTTLAPLNVTGAINFNGTPTVSVLIAGSLPAGTYPLMTAAGGLSGSMPTTANLSLPPYVSATLSNDANNVYLVVTGDTEPIKWAVDGTGSWDIATTASWKDNTATTVDYLQSADVPPVGDSVVFDDTYFADARTVTLNTTVNPVAVTVNSANNYTITGTGGIAGETGLSKQGAGTLELDTVNTYTGGTTIGAGALTIGGAGQLGGGTYSAGIVNNGTLNYNSSAAQTLSGPISGGGALAQGNGTLILSAANNIGATTIAAPATLQIGDGVLYNGSSVPGGNILDNGNLVITSFYPQTYSGNLSGSGTFTVNNPTSLTLSGSINSYSGGFTINAALGSLIFNNAALQTLSGLISGSGTLVQAGSGTLTLNATAINNYSGGTIINTGTTLSVNAIDNGGFNPTAIPATGTVTLGGTGATLQYTGASPATLGATAPVSGTGTIDLPSGNLEVDLAKSGTITKTSGGTLILAGTADNASLGLIVSGGTVILDKASQSTAHAVGSTTTVNNGGTLQLSGTGGDQIYSGVNVTINSGGVFDANGLSEGMTSLTLYGNGTGSGPLINNTGTPSTITCTATPGGFLLGNNLSFASSGNLTLVGVISNLNNIAYSITNVGPGTLALNSVNTFSGGLTINAGATVVLNSYAGAGTNTITINGNGILSCNASDGATTTYTNAITGGSTSVIKVTTVSGNTYLGGDLTHFSGTVYCNGGQTVIGVPNNAAYPISAAATWSISNTCTLDLQTPYVTDAASVIVNGTGNNAMGCLRLDACNQTGPVLLTTNTCTIGNGNTAASTISGVISDGGNNYGFTKTGNNANQTLVLSAANTYTGPTTNTIGTLEISGSIKGNVTVTGGTNQFDNTTAMAATATLNLVAAPLNGAVNLNYSGTMTIAALNFGATSMAQGTWGAIGSGATHQNAAFIGTGLLNVTSGGTVTTTTLGSVPSTLCFGAPLNLTATVTGGTTGDTVQFLDGVTVLGTGTLSSGAASYSASGLVVGPHSITAKYLGSNIANPSTSSPAANVTVNTCVSKSPVTITKTVNNGDGSITISYIGGAGASFTLMESPVVPSAGGQDRDNWTPVGVNQPSTPGSFTITPSGNSFYTIRSN